MQRDMQREERSEEQRDERGTPRDEGGAEARGATPSMATPPDPSQGVTEGGAPTDEGPPPEVIYLTPEQAAGMAMMEGVLPLFLAAAHAMEEGYAEAEPLATALIGLLEGNAREMHEENDSEGLWTAAASLCRAVFVERRRALDLIELTKELDRHAGYAWKALCALSYLGASVDKYAIPPLRVSLHMAIAEFVYAGTSRNPDLYATTVAPWFEAYWVRTFERMRFRFQTPKLVEIDLRAARECDPAVRVQRILRSVAFGLNVSLPERGREWFERV